MRKLLTGMLVTVTMVVMMSMSVFATTDNYLPSPSVPGDDYIKDQEPGDDKPDEVPGDEHMKDRSPKTGDDRIVLYGIAMTAIAAAGTVVIAKKKEA